ncbi:MAG: Ig-like domain-containing protein [Ferruginibacter sp.]
MKKIYAVFLVLFLYHLSANSQVVINEIYGGGGNAGSIYRNDFIELYNNSAAPVSLAGWSVQYASAAGTTWAVTNLSGSIPANGYYLVQQAVGAGGTTNLPAPDATGTIAMSGTAGKVALANTVTALSGLCPTGGAIMDFVGFGATASCFEGAAPTPAPSNTTSVQRTPIGTDTQNNSADFTAGSPTPNNSGGGPDVTPPTIVTLSPASMATGVATSFTANITLSESIAKAASGNIIIKKVADNSIVQTIDILNSSVTINAANLFFPVYSLAFGTAYYVEITAGAFKDLAGNNFAGITGSGAWSFTTTATPPQGTAGTTYNFNTCSSSVTNGFTFYSVTGAEVWACTTFGRDPANPGGTTAFESAVQINGFNAGTNVLNEDWFISPAFDLTATNYPLLSYWSRTAFNGAPLQLKVSTDYPGTGNPAAYTWTDLNGRFPAQASNIWTQTQDINLTAFKSTKTYFAFVYNSTIDDGARWTLDDILVSNSATPPPASLNTSTTDIQFGYVPVSTPSVKYFSFTANDITASVTLTATTNFLISKTNGGFTNSITYTQAEANNIPQTVYVQFTPPQNSLNYVGTITVTTSGVANSVVNLAGNSIDAALTLEVVNWNIEWYGTSEPGFGPTNKVLQAANIKKITQNIGADLFAFVEVVSEDSLQNIVTSLNNVYGAGTYSYVICNYGSHTNPFETGASPLSTAQKEAFVYKNSVIAPIGTPGALLANGVNSAADLTNPAYDYFSSGRYPYMMNANVTLGGITKAVRFVLIHAKANTSPTATSYTRRKKSADTLNYTLNTLYPNDNIVLLGDFNDDLDQSITAGQTVSSYSTFNADAANFFAPTLALSLAGKKSTVSYNDMIDHVEISNEMQPFYMQNSASVLTDVSSLVTNYGSTTTDHYPVFTRYAFDPVILPVTLVSFTATKQNSAVVLNWSTSQELNSKSFVVERSVDNTKWVSVGTVNAAGTSAGSRTYTLTDFGPAKGISYYRLKQVDIDEKVKYSLTRKISFDKTTFITISPNPAKGFTKVRIEKNNTAAVTIEVLDISGRSIQKVLATSSYIQINTSALTKGTYFLKVTNGQEINIEKLLIQ